MRQVRRLFPLLLLSATACTVPPPPGAPADLWRRAWPEIRWTYDRLALERDGLCTQPQLEGITRVEVRERTPERVVLRISYWFRDDASEDDYGWGFTGVLRRCAGFAERTFVIDPQSGRVLAMGGPQRKPRDFSPR